MKCCLKFHFFKNRKRKFYFPIPVESEFDDILIYRLSVDKLLECYYIKFIRK